MCPKYSGQHGSCMTLSGPCTHHNFGTEEKAVLRKREKGACDGISSPLWNLSYVRPNGPQLLHRLIKVLNKFPPAAATHDRTLGALKQRTFILSQKPDTGLTVSVGLVPSGGSKRDVCLSVFLPFCLLSFLPFSLSSFLSSF